MSAAEPGAGPVVVLLHGGGPGVDAVSNWASVRSRLDGEFRCLAPDLLGFGARIAGTGGIEGPRAWALARARQVLDLLDSDGLERVHLVGNSAAGGAAALALHGELDRVSPVEVSERLVDALPDGRLAVVAGAGHWIHVDRPDEFCSLVGEFLSA